MTIKTEQPAPSHTSATLAPSLRQGRIEVVDVSKKFTLSQARAGELREWMTNLGKKRAPALTEQAPASRVPQVSQEKRGKQGEFWALRDVSFEVKPGEPVGIIGHNGSGKSTMLKLLTGILKPTHGEVRVTGRVGALIEVGAGFHPDLSGRENVYLNGSILGLSRREIDRKMDEIVSFAGLETFIDTPVKRYSSGMYMRLGFAVAAHTDPDILLIDEVLAVGDQQFQNKCMAHLKNFVKQGGAVVFVGHAMVQVKELCQTVVLLDHGQVLEVGEPDKVVETYMTLVAEREEEEFKRTRPKEWQEREQAKKQVEEEAKKEAMRKHLDSLALSEARLVKDRCHDEERERLQADPRRARILGVRLYNEHGQNHPENQPIQAGSVLKAVVSYKIGRELPHAVVGMEVFHAQTGQHLFSTSNFDHDMWLPAYPHEGKVTLTIPFVSLNEGQYRLRLTAYPDSTKRSWWLHPEDVIEDATTLYVKAGRFAHGVVYLPVLWSVESVKSIESVEEVQRQIVEQSETGVIGSTVLPTDREMLVPVLVQSRNSIKEPVVQG